MAQQLQAMPAIDNDSNSSRKMVLLHYGVILTTSFGSPQFTSIAVRLHLSERQPLPREVAMLEETPMDDSESGMLTALIDDGCDWKQRPDNEWVYVQRVLPRMPRLFRTRCLNGVQYTTLRGNVCGCRRSGCGVADNMRFTDTLQSMLVGNRYIKVGLPVELCVRASVAVRWAVSSDIAAVEAVSIMATNHPMTIAGNLFLIDRLATNTTSMDRTMLHQRFWPLVTAVMVPEITGTGPLLGHTLVTTESILSCDYMIPVLVNGNTYESATEAYKSLTLHLRHHRSTRLQKLDIMINVLVSKFTPIAVRRYLLAHPNTIYSVVDTSLFWGTGPVTSYYEGHNVVGVALTWLRDIMTESPLTELHSDWSSEILASLFKRLERTPFPVDPIVEDDESDPYHDWAQDFNLEPTAVSPERQISTWRAGFSGITRANHQHQQSGTGRHQLSRHAFSVRQTNDGLVGFPAQSQSVHFIQWLYEESTRVISVGPTTTFIHQSGVVTLRQVAPDIYRVGITGSSTTVIGYLCATSPRVLLQEYFLNPTNIPIVYAESRNRDFQMLGQTYTLRHQTAVRRAFETLLSSRYAMRVLSQASTYMAIEIDYMPMGWFDTGFCNDDDVDYWYNIFTDDFDEVVEFNAFSDALNRDFQDFDRTLADDQLSYFEQFNWGTPEDNNVFDWGETIDSDAPETPRLTDRQQLYEAVPLLQLPSLLFSKTRTKLLDLVTATEPSYNHIVAHLTHAMLVDLLFSRCLSNRRVTKDQYLIKLRYYYGNKAKPSRKSYKIIPNRSGDTTYRAYPVVYKRLVRNILEAMVHWLLTDASSTRVLDAVATARLRAAAARLTASSCDVELDLLCNVDYHVTVPYYDIRESCYDVIVE